MSINLKKVTVFFVVKLPQSHMIHTSSLWTNNIQTKIDFQDSLMMSHGMKVRFPLQNFCDYLCKTFFCCVCKCDEYIVLTHYFMYKLFKHISVHKLQYFIISFKREYLSCSGVLKYRNSVFFIY